jgi:hypothetical protein
MRNDVPPDAQMRPHAPAQHSHLRGYSREGDVPADAVYLEGEHHVREYTRAFDGLRAAALSPQRSALLIESILKDYT